MRDLEVNANQSNLLVTELGEWNSEGANGYVVNNVEVIPRQTPEFVICVLISSFNSCWRLYGRINGHQLL